MGIAKACHNVVIPTLRIGIFLVYECDSAQATLQSGNEIVVREIAFESHPFFARAVEEKYSRGPDGVETMEPCRVLLDVGFDGQEILLDKLRSFLIFVGLGIQPSTSTSGRGCTEIH